MSRLFAKCHTYHTPKSEKNSVQSEDVSHSFIPVFVKFQVCQVVVIQNLFSESILCSGETDMLTMAVQNENWYVTKVPRV